MKNITPRRVPYEPEYDPPEIAALIAEYRKKFSRLWLINLALNVALWVALAASDIYFPPHGFWAVIRYGCLAFVGYMVSDNWRRYRAALKWRPRF